MELEVDGLGEAEWEIDGKKPLCMTRGRGGGLRSRFGQ